MIIIISLLFVLPVVLILIGAFTEPIRRENYYSEKDHYVNEFGVVTRFEYYGKNNDKLYIYVKNELYIKEGKAPPDTTYTTKIVIVGNNLNYLKDNGIDEKIKLGSFIEFATVQKNFGYARPIVSLTVDGEVLLEFEDGYANLLEWLQSGGLKR